MKMVMASQGSLGASCLAGRFDRCRERMNIECSSGCVAMFNTAHLRSTFGNGMVGRALVGTAEISSVRSIDLYFSAWTTDSSRVSSPSSDSTESEEFEMRSATSPLHVACGECKETLGTSCNTGSLRVSPSNSNSSDCCRTGPNSLLVRTFSLTVFSINSSSNCSAIKEICEDRPGTLPRGEVITCWNCSACVVLRRFSLLSYAGSGIVTCSALGSSVTEITLMDEPDEFRWRPCWVFSQ